MIKPFLKRVVLAAICCFQSSLVLNAQSSVEDIVANLSTDQRVIDFTIDPNRGTPSLIKMNPTGNVLLLEQTSVFLQSVLGFGEETSFINESTSNANGWQVDKLQQYTHGIKVEHGVFKVMSKKDIVLAFTAEYYHLPASMPSTASLSESNALQFALNHVGATTYAWDYLLSLGNSPEIMAAYDEVYPNGELVFVDNYLTEPIDLTLAYKFNVYAAEPLSRADVYVDANTGEILLLDAIIKHVGASHTKKQIADLALPFSASTTTGSGQTRYAGVRNFDTSLDGNGNYVLKGVTPSGIENETLSYEGLGGLPLNIPAISMLAVPIADGDGNILHPETADNNWTAAEHRKDIFSPTNPYPLANESRNDDVALDAHWGAEIVLDYWKNVHNRSSYDDQGTKVTNYVHYGDAYDNAFWNGTAMTYGDGSYQGGTHPDGSFAPLTSMDVCAHEIGHGVCEYTADLVYQRESGAMNEGFSDIWAAAVEAYVLSEVDGSLDFDTWGIGEQIDERDGGLPPGQAGTRALRWMDDPKAAGDPDSYGGTNWIDPECGTPTLANDQCGVHTNSGVLNKWYYLLVAGSGQSLSAGYNKQLADDQLSDAGNAYFVQGLGFMKASKIAYMAETMLSPNAKFIEMRAASILSAQLLYGIASNEEIQTTNAWYAVDIGSAYDTGEPNTINFSDSNPLILSESNLINGCEDFNTYSIVLSGVAINPSATITLNLAGSTASQGVDYDLSTTSLTFNGSETKSVDIIVYDDAVMENAETIVVSFIYNGQFMKQEYAISDNDFAPRTESGSVDLLTTETFSVDGAPAGWEVLSLSEGNNVWKFNGDVNAEGRAYISDGISDLAFYDQNSPTHTILRSPLLNASAASDVTVSFDWEVGGETDAVDPNTIFDYGEFVYSLNGSNYISMQQFVGSGPLGAITESGNYSAVINALDGQVFYLGWRWFNDTNAGTQFSFAIDNVAVTATPAGIETQIHESSTTTVNQGTSIYFMSESDQALIAKIENASSDLGCVTLSLIDEGSSFRVFSNISTARPSKAFSITTENNEATYDLTVYFTESELNAFDETVTLLPMKVNSSNIDDADDLVGNFVVNGVLTDINADGQYRAYTGTFSGSGSVSIVQDFAYCTQAPAPWETNDIGTVNKAGALCYIDGDFESYGSGSGITAKSDSFYFIYQELNGDGEIIAKVNALENTNNFAKAAVMIRQSIDANSKFAMTSIVSNPNLLGSSARFEYRKSTGGNASGASYVSTSTPEYIRIVRTGNSITSYISESNGNWQLIGSKNVNMGNSVYVGLATTSNANGISAMASFSEVEVIQSGAGARIGESTTSNELMAGMRIFPNPVADQLNIELTKLEVRSIVVYNLLGEAVKTVHLDRNQPQVQLDVTGLTKGLFILKIHTEDNLTLNHKFFKH